MFETILIIGLGGAGQRHLRIIKNILPNARFIAYRELEKTPLLNPNFTIDNKSSIESKYGVHIYHNLNDSYKEKPDLVVICTPTSLHCEHIIRASNEGAAILVEKPGSMSHLEALKASEILKKNNTKFLISFQRRFHPLVTKLKNLLENNLIGKIDSITAKVSSYVPAWHPYEDYKNLYACRSSLGGGVLLTESHEIDFIIWIFGLPDSLKSNLGVRKDLSIDVEDSATIQLDYNNFVVNLELDFMSENTQRIIDINTDEGSMSIDLESQTFSLKDIGGKVSTSKTNISNDRMFEDQFNYFISSDKNNLDYIVSLVDNLQLIDQCKKINNHNSDNKLHA